MTKVEEALAEITAALAVLEPVEEGLEDYAALDLKPPTQVDVQAALAQYHNRIAALTAAQTALEVLLAFGYPAPIVIPPIEKPAYDDLVANRDTIEAALGIFKVNEAERVEIVFGTPEEQ